MKNPVLKTFPHIPFPNHLSSTSQHPARNLTAPCKEVTHKTPPSHRYSIFHQAGVTLLYRAGRDAPPPAPRAGVQLWSITAHEAPVPPGRPEEALPPVLLRSPMKHTSPRARPGRCQAVTAHLACLSTRKGRGAGAQQQPQQPGTICLLRAPCPQWTSSSLGSFAVAVMGNGAS